MTNIEYLFVFYLLSIAAGEAQESVNCYVSPGTDCGLMMLPTIVLLMITFFLGLLAFLIHSIMYAKKLSSIKNKGKPFRWSIKERNLFWISCITYIIFASTAGVMSGWVEILLKSF